MIVPAGDVIASDTGSGISQENLVDIFEPFSRASRSTSKKLGGTGLGLAITKNLVELMGGTIWVDSEIGQGSTFQFTAGFKTEKNT